MALIVSLSFVTTQIDNLIVGRLLGAAALGVYLFAYRLASLPIDHIQAVAGSVAISSYVQHRSGRPAALAAQLQRVLIPFTALLCAGLLTTAAWGRTALAAVIIGAAGLMAERSDASPLWVAPAALCIYLAMALRLEPMLRHRLQRLLSAGVG